MNILNEIIERVKEDLLRTKKRVPLATIKNDAKQAPKVANFAAALAKNDGKPNIIAELKCASPSKGIIRPDFGVNQLSHELEDSGAAALSVLTEINYFRGSPRYLQAVAGQVSIPLLRKDFIIDPYQIYEAKAWGASAILLIAAALTGEQYILLYELARSLDLSVLTEIHNDFELEMITNKGAHIIGVNSRDLRTFKVDLAVTARLITEIPDDCLKVAESGINTSADILRMKDAGANAFLIGETLMREPSPGEKLRNIIAGCQK